MPRGTDLGGVRSETFVLIDDAFRASGALCVGRVRLVHCLDHGTLRFGARTRISRDLEHFRNEDETQGDRHAQQNEDGRQNVRAFVLIAKEVADDGRGDTQQNHVVQTHADVGRIVERGDAYVACSPRETRADDLGGSVDTSTLDRNTSAYHQYALVDGLHRHPDRPTVASAFLVDPENDDVFVLGLHACKRKRACRYIGRLKRKGLVTCR